MMCPLASLKTMDSGLDMLMIACDGLVNGRLVLKKALGVVFEDSGQMVDVREGGVLISFCCQAASSFFNGSFDCFLVMWLFIVCIRMKGQTLKDLYILN